LKDQFYKTFDGWKVYLTGLDVFPTFRGCLEGTPDDNSLAIIKWLRQGKAHHPNKDLPVLAMIPSQLPLPPYTWEAELNSRQCLHTKDPDFNSHLLVVWFTDGLDHNIAELTQKTVSQITWKEHAKDYDWMP
jgi:hypothetical protein